jgi:hypothetical protein
MGTTCCELSFGVRLPAVFVFSPAVVVARGGKGALRWPVIVSTNELRDKDFMKQFKESYDNFPHG